MAAWIKQLAGQVKKQGAEKASWYVEWNEPDGTRRCKSCGPGPKGKRNADRLSARIEAELLTGTYDRRANKTWKDFRSEYETRILPSMEPTSAVTVRIALNHFERLVKLSVLPGITTEAIDKFKANRREERGRKPGSKVSPATINRDLRHLKQVLRIANEWGYLPTVPRFRFEKEPKKLPAFVTQEDFAVMYVECDVAVLPDEVSYPASDWWRGLLTMAYMTGWRIGDLGLAVG
jgi:hypothetical protein